MALTLTIAGVDRTSLLQVNTLNITDELNSRNTCSFDLLDKTGVWRPSMGQSVALTDGPKTFFAGTIDDLDEEKLDGSPALHFEVACVDKNQIADRHLVARVYETPGQTLRDIVLDIVAQDLAGEGLTTTYVQTGPVIEKAVFNYVTAADAFNDLSSLTGYSWSIDYTGNLRFFERSTYAAPFALTDASANFRKLKVKRTRAQYRNRQFIRAGMDLTDPRTETFKGNGADKAFLLAYPVGKVPSAVTVDGVSKTIGIKGVDTGKDFYWNKGDATITQADGAAALTSANTLSVTYQGLFPITLNAQDDAQIAAMQAAEGGSGIYEAVVDEPNIDSANVAMSEALGLLRKHGRIPLTVEFETDVDGLAGGQLLPITLTAHALNGQYLIESVKASDVDGLSMRYQVKALDGEAVGGWVEFFATMARQGRTFVIRENEVVSYLRALRDAVTCSDTLTYTSAAPESRAGYALAGYSEAAP